jgi:hypothetical protein
MLPLFINAGCVTTTSIAYDTLVLGLFLRDKELVTKLRIHFFSFVVESPGLQKLTGFRPCLQQLQLCYLNTGIASCAKYLYVCSIHLSIELSFTELSKQERTQGARLVGEAREREGQGEGLRQQEGGSKPADGKQTETECQVDGEDCEEAYAV